MAYDFQVTIDAADPHAQADWWADALRWVVEPSDEAFIRRMIAEGYASDDDTKLHDGHLVWRVAALGNSHRLLRLSTVEPVHDRKPRRRPGR